MLRPLVRDILLPAHEALLGRSTFSILRQLQAPTVLTAADLRCLQLQKLRALIDHARAHIPYWRERLRPCETLTDPAKLLASIPVLTRAEIRRNREAMRWADAPGKTLIHSSGGTTDDNLTFYWGRSRQSWDRALRYRGLARLGISPGDRVLHLWPTYPKRKPLERLKEALRAARDWATNDVVFDLRPLTPQRLDAAWAWCRSYKPKLIIAYPSWLVALAERLQAGGVRPTLPSLRMLLCTGEVLFDFQRRLLEETFGVPVRQEYGSQDAGLIAHEDSEEILRPNTECLYVECLRDGSTAAPGDLGEVVITHFHSEIMPFIRYATGDVIRQPADTRTFGDGLPAFPMPEGRTSDMLLRTDGAVCAMRPLIEALIGAAEMRDFHLQQLTANRLVVLEVSRSNVRSRLHDKAEEIIQAMLGSDMTVEWHQGEGLTPLFSGKKRYVCSVPAMRLIAHDRESGLDQARAWSQRFIDDEPLSKPPGFAHAGITPMAAQPGGFANERDGVLR